MLLNLKQNDISDWTDSDSNEETFQITCCFSGILIVNFSISAHLHLNCYKILEYFQ